MTTALPTEAPAARRLPGYLIIWALILAEMLVFAALFASYAFARVSNVAPLRPT